LRPALQRVGRSHAATLAVAALGGIVALPVLLSTVWRRGPADRVAAAVGPHRVSRARLTGSYAYASCRPLTPNDSLVTGLACADEAPSAWPQSRALGKLAAALKSSVATDSTSVASRHAIGAWNIVWRNTDAAIEELRVAAALDPRNAAVQSDLAVALLQHAELAQDPLSIVDAYSANDRALAMAPRLTEAVFNRALILECLYLRELAVGQWKAYLAIDDRSPWADEARNRLLELERPAASWSSARRNVERAAARGDSAGLADAVRQFPWRARNDVRALLIQWARLYTSGDARADTVSRQALTLAGAAWVATGDGLWADVARGIDTLISVGDTSRLRRLATGLTAFDRGRSELDKGKLDSASSSLDRAFELLSSVRSPGSHLAAYDRARVSFQRHTDASYTDARARFRRIATEAPARYPLVRALATRNVGFIENIRANFDVAASAFSAAMAEGAGVREPALDLRTRTDAARLAATLRGDRAGWHELYKAFRNLPAYADVPGDAQRVFSTAAVLTWHRSPRVALLFQREFVRLSASVGDSLLMVSALTREAELLAREGMRSEALASLGRIPAYASGIGSDSLRAIMLADADLVYGQVWLPELPDSAVRVLKRVVERYDGAQYLAQAGRAKLRLADAYVAAGAPDSARVAFDQALGIIERARSGIASHDDRTRFLDEARPIIDTVAGFYLSRQDTIGALDFTERMRARVLLERAGNMAPNANPSYRSVDAIRRALDPRTTILSYLVLEREIVGWVIRRDGVWMHRVPADDATADLATRLTRLVATRTSGEEIATTSARLRDVLIEPFESRIPTDSRLIIVPDKWLHFVPYAALFDARRQRYLVQSYELGIASSVQLFADAVARSGALGVDESSVLAVGNPAFDRSVYNLPTLAGAEREARDVARRYPGARLLIGADATRSAFLEQARAASVIHFAGHGVISTDAPLLSQLVLAPDRFPGSSGALYARDLFDLSLPITRLAILSGCRTADGALSGTEGASSLARALFAAGVPAVIAGLWSVDDRSTEAFFATFHADLSQHQDPAAALRRTQIQWIEQGDPWRTAQTWAAFQIFGAATAPGLRDVISEKRISRSSNSVVRTEPSPKKSGR